MGNGSHLADTMTLIKQHIIIIIIWASCSFIFCIHITSTEILFAVYTFNNKIMWRHKIGSHWWSEVSLLYYISILKRDETKISQK